MDPVEKMVSQVLEKGQQQVKEFLANEKKRIEEDELKETTALKESEAETLKKSLRSLEKDYQQELQRQETTSRQETLNIKQDYLAKLFEEAVEVMNNWDQETYQAFCGQGILQVPDFPHSEIILGEYAVGKLDDQWLATINQQKKYPLTFSSQVENKQGGLIVSQSGVEYNFLFSSLVQEIKDSQSFLISEILFKES